jgi:uncharacterized repeat protein (TIGR01451 family)
VIPSPDLVVSNSVSPTSAALNEMIEVSWTVTNQGVGTAEFDWYDAIYLSRDEIWDNSDTLIESFWAGEQATLESGSSYTVNSNISIPNSSTAIGEHYLLFVADRNGTQIETNETNNHRAVPITIKAPNLMIEAVTAPAEASLNQSISITWTVTNNGEVATSTGWWDYVYLSDDEILDSSDTYLTYRRRSPSAALDTEASYTVTDEVTLPNTEIGTHYLLFTTDRYNSLGETKETDNLLALPIELKAPNLVVLSVTAPQQAIVNQTISVSWTVMNTGEIAASADWYDYVYLSDDETLDPSDTVIASQRTGTFTPLEAQNSYDVTRNLTIPQTETGSRYLLFVADGSQQQGETDETDNVRAVPIEFKAPDLAITGTTAPATAVLGQKITFSWTVTNQGEVAAPGYWFDAVFFSDDPHLDYGDQYIYDSADGDGGFSNLADGDSYTVERSLTIPRNWQPGNHYLLFLTDNSRYDYIENYGQKETNENNNLLAVPFQLIALDVDLSVSEIFTQVEAFAGDEIEIVWTVTNSGSDKATGTWTDSIYLSDDAAIGSDQFFGSFSFSGTLAGGESIERRQTLYLPKTLMGEYWLVTKTDADDQLIEYGQEDNNATISQQPIKVIRPAFPNLQVSRVTAPPTAFSGQETVIEWTVTNTGDGATSAPVWYDRLWLSLDQTLDSSDLELGQAPNPSYLKAEDSYSNSLTVTLPQGVDSNYYFLVETDYTNKVLELNSEGDNLGASHPTDVELTSPPDLQVASVSAPSQVFSGQPMSLSWTVTNAGAGQTLKSHWYDEIYLSADPVWDGEDYFLARQTHLGVLNAGESYKGLSRDQCKIVQNDPQPLIPSRFQKYQSAKELPPPRVGVNYANPPHNRHNA